MAFLRNINLRDWLFVIVAVVLLGVMVQYNRMQREVVNSAVTDSQQKITIKSQDVAIKTDQAIKKIDEATQVAVEKEVTAANQKHEAIQRKVAEKENVMRSRRENETHSPVDYAAEQRELSEIRIDGIWEAYCASVPDAAACQPPED